MSRYVRSRQSKINPLPDDKNLVRSKLKQFADDNSKFDENSRKFSKQVENTVGKGEIARQEQFLLFAQCFQKACFPGVSKGVILWEWYNRNRLNCPLIKLKMMWQKEKYAGYQHFPHIVFHPWGP